jgi:ABC-type polysaccharide/polyol phosphate transport system ATPase subunit
LETDIAIRTEELGKEYVIGHKKSGDLRNTFNDKFNDFFGKNKTKESFWAIEDLDLEIKKGDAVGVIGKNGAGKSTLLKILSRITEPSKGRFEINGRVSSLLEVGTGFHMELTGRENVFLNGTILGMTRSEIKTKFDEIVDFSGVEKFLDTPVKHYSSGMKVRLAFSVAAHLEPEILIVDEVLAVGDADFQKKCLGKMNEVSKQNGRTILFVSHNMGAINNLCTSCIMLDQGKLDIHDSTNKVISKYLNSLDSGITHSGVTVKSRFEKGDTWEVNTNIMIDITWDPAQQNFDEYTCCDLACYTFDGVKVFAFQTDKFEGANLSGRNGITFSINNVGYPNNSLFIDIGFRSKGSGVYSILLQRCISTIPGCDSLPEYYRNDTITVPLVKYQLL